MSTIVRSQPRSRQAVHLVAVDERMVLGETLPQCIRRHVSRLARLAGRAQQRDPSTTPQRVLEGQFVRRLGVPSLPAAFFIE